MMKLGSSVTVKNVLLVVALITVLGFLLYSFSGKEKFHIPDTFEIGKKSHLLLGLVVLYFILSFAILYLFFQPKSAGGTAAVAGGALLWSIY